MTPIPGVTYWFDVPTLTWKAVGREDIPLNPIIDPDPTPSTGYGSGAYGSTPYGG